jgi:hypothetical protein
VGVGAHLKVIWRVTSDRVRIGYLFRMLVIRKIFITESLGVGSRGWGIRA